MARRSPRTTSTGSAALFDASGSTPPRASCVTSSVHHATPAPAAACGHRGAASVAQQHDLDRLIDSTLLGQLAALRRGSPSPMRTSTSASSTRRPRRNSVTSARSRSRPRPRPARPTPPTPRRPQRRRPPTRRLPTSRAARRSRTWPRQSRPTRTRPPVATRAGSSPTISRSISPCWRPRSPDGPGRDRRRRRRRRHLCDLLHRAMTRCRRRRRRRRSRPGRSGRTRPRARRDRATDRLRRPSPRRHRWPLGVRRDCLGDSSNDLPPLMSASALSAAAFAAAFWASVGSVAPVVTSGGS